jgi:putative transposase
VYPVIFIDAIVVKVRDGQVRNKLIYVVIRVTVNGERDILGLWVGDGNEDAKFWLQVLTELKNRGVADVCIAVCDGLRGLPEAINTVWELTTVQACIIHLIRNTFRYASRKYWDQIAHDLRPIYTAATEAEARARSTEFADKWVSLYPAITKLWANVWSEFVPFLDYGGRRRLPPQRRERWIGGGTWPRGLVEPAGAGGALRVSLWGLIGESS